jgi:hypothetical protein
MSFYEESTIEWYINWLVENRPDLTEEQRKEVATGFVALQQPTKPAPEAEFEYEEGKTGDSRADQRRQQRLSKATLEKITGVKI